jgi:hypothetical protein
MEMNLSTRRNSRIMVHLTIRFKCMSRHPLYPKSMYLDWWHPCIELQKSQQLLIVVFLFLFRFLSTNHQTKFPFPSHLLNRPPNQHLNVLFPISHPIFSIIHHPFVNCLLQCYHLPNQLPMILLPMIPSIYLLLPNLFPSMHQTIFQTPTLNSPPALHRLIVVFNLPNLIRIPRLIVVFPPTLTNLHRLIVVFLFPILPTSNFL